ncbi:PR domain zinc finger protein 2 isoform X2 [Pantherophis guttatus]|uniref:PR domain zinc finger protein 2 isoform X2 n=1 Tax=Pantherophis guttatus TaxID=94885 RepID=A0A6P9CM70_PANGU|nr:PR domain zinc finger protein 2 isoform X2 [Pantherophis guttatus]XP_034280216.1 PR domain zinc finger protein 2 isoform X2 [Pantherophis guttatus]
MNQNSTGPSGSVETLADVPQHILKGLPEEVRLLPSTVDKARLGVWATKPIFRGRKFGPFVGDKKKRSQVKSNVYMWEVYYPNLGWMCVDATDPAKGNWLRYVNWARSGKEQNLFPLEINRTIYYKTLKPIEPGDELLVWYNGEENAEIAAALEEERASHHRSKRRNSPKAKKAKKKPQETKNKGKKARDKKRKPPLEGLDLTPFDMRETKEGQKLEDEAPTVSVVLPLDQAAIIQEMVNQDVLPSLLISSVACELPATPEDQPEVLLCGSKVSEEDPERREEQDEEEEQEPLEEAGEEEDEEEPQEEEEEDEESLLKENPDVESGSVCGDRLVESVEEQSSLSEDSPESSPKKKPSGKCPKTRGEPSTQGVPMFPCQHCERKFTTKQGLERHVHIHISAISHAFKCRYCGKAFGTQINRRRHERRHEAGPKRKLLSPLASAQLPGASPLVADGGIQNEAKARQEGPAPEAERATSKTPSPSLPLEESKEPKESHPCQYCRKVFGTHTNMRRHQRRVHERHLIPKGVRRKPEEPQASVCPAQQTPSTYLASTDLEEEEEEEGEADDVMDVSSNISENLNYYIDGKIPSNSSTSNCEVIEVEPSATEVYGINCLLSPVTVEISPNIKAVPVHLVEESKEPPVGGTPEAKKRRTASPPLLAKVKTETDPEPITSLCSLTIPLTISTVESLPFPREKSVYLSSKLKQLLQTQDNNKVAPSPPLPAGEIPKLGLPAISSPLLPATSSRFKRRTSSPQHSPGLRDPGKAGEGKPSWTEAALSAKPPKLERRSNSPTWSLSGREEREVLSPEEYKVSREWAPSPPFGNVCNQQPLDLSSSVKQRSNGKNRAQASWESVLDLSMQRKPCSDGEGKEVTLPAGGAVKKKPTTSMLQKVLLNEYNGTGLGPENPSPDTSPRPNACQVAEAPEPQPGPAPPAPGAESGCSGLTATEVPLLPSSTCPAPSASPSHPPCPPMLQAPTPPPPLLPTVPSPLPEDPSSSPPSSCPSPLSNATAHSPLPILSPTVSASPLHSLEPLGCASPGPPTLSSSSSSSSPSPSSSSSSSFSSSSSSASPSSSPSPPPLSVVSSILSPGDQLENSAPLVTFKQEEGEAVGQRLREDPHPSSAAEAVQETFSKSFVCNVCQAPFLAIKDLTRHLSVHAGEWPFKCEFCVQLFREKAALSEHRFLLHGVGSIFACSACKKEFAFLCNLQQHQRDLHPDKECSHHQFESGTLRLQNFTDPSKASVEQMQSLPNAATLQPSKEEEEEEEELNDSSEELYTTIKIMAAGVKQKDPDVRMGLNQHYPSFKPPPFQYHHRNPNGIGATATNFTTHNIPQTFSTAIRCTKCGKSVDNMPELHKHILACASASDKKRYTPKKNPVPLKQAIRPKNGVVLPGLAGNTFRRVGQPKQLDFGVEASRAASNKLKLSALKKKQQLVQKAILQKKKSQQQQQRAELRTGSAEPSAHICPYCSREFTYIGSLNKHASYSCPKKPPSSSSSSSSSKKKAKKKGGGSSPGSGKSGANPRRRTADTEIKMQGSAAQLGKTRARTSGPAAVQLPSASFKLKQGVKFPKKGHPPPPASRSVGPARVGKAVLPEGKRSKGAAKSGGPSPGLLGKASRKLHIRIQRGKAALAGQRKAANRFSAKSRERVGGPITRSLQQQQATSAEATEARREESTARPELKDSRSLP